MIPSRGRPVHVDSGNDTGADDRERGSIAVELVILAPLLIALLVLVVGLGRIAQTRGQVDAAASDAARAASLTRTAATAELAGENAARANLGDRCQALDVHIDTTALRPGGEVAARVRCVISLARLGLAGFPGSRAFTATVHVPIDRYRGAHG
ncbi:TadE/TadG family type IV pilus assembly protein [Sporichthya polymorpha]|uniref:TadE/TadG family type IV pilus assembly protein n=1 Tax=Sporichthya polymorpha TaxID=35751 RepID=UPI00036D5E92|nr:TadE/TadG family type IV pilus assembly protein [Sporichthya polymorpha]